jgi:thioredoxin-dependent peroxiredoxin
LTALNVAVYGISPDDLASHQAFAAKHNLNFPLLADVGHVLLEQWGFWGERERDGKKFMGVFRSTVLVGPDGVIERVWKNVNFQGHADEVLAAIEAIVK